MSSPAATSSVPAPLFPTPYMPVLCDPRDSIEMGVSDMFRTPVASLQYMPMAVLTVLYLSGLYCMRIAELLEIRYGDSVGHGRWLVHGAKGSRSYVIAMPGLHGPAAAEIAARPDARLFPLHYRYVWSWCQKLGVGFTPENRQTVARTHAHRYVTARQVTTQTTERVAGDVLHHRSTRSISYYLSTKGVSYGKDSERDHGRNPGQGRRGRRR